MHVVEKVSDSQVLPVEELAADSKDLTEKKRVSTGIPHLIFLSEEVCQKASLILLRVILARVKPFLPLRLS